MADVTFADNSAHERERLLLELYKSAFPAVARFVSKRGGTIEQAQDVFQEALLVWYEKSPPFNNARVHSDQAYFFGIAKHLWFRKFAEIKHTVSLEPEEAQLSTGANDDRYSAGKLLALLESTGKKCLDMLKSFYYDKLSMPELADTFGFGSVRSATVQKYKCLERVRETVKQKSLRYEDFLE